MYGSTSSGSVPLLSADGKTLLTDKGKILERWPQNFDSVLNRPSTINAEAINRLPQEPINEAPDDPPTLLETQKAIRLLSSGKAPGLNSIPAEVYKKGVAALTEKLHQLFLLMWQQKTIPQDLKDASIIHLYKRRGNRQACDNHRGKCLLCIAGKILARILMNRLTTYLDQGLLPESQCAFRKERGTVDMVFPARQLQEKRQEQNSDLFFTFVDLTKAFYTVCREGLWKVMTKYGWPRKFISMVKQFHYGMQARVQNSGKISDPSPVSNGIKQSCVLAPTLFSFMLSVMLTDAFGDGNVGVNFKYSTDGKLFNLRRLQVMTDIIRNFLFADDCPLSAGSGDYPTQRRQVFPCQHRL